MFYELINLKRPATYFLQEAMERGMNALTARLDRNEGNRPYFVLQIIPQPVLDHAIWDNGDMTSRFLDVFILAGQAIGGLNLEDEESLRKRLYTCEPYEHPFMATRLLITLVDEYLRKPSAYQRHCVDELIGVIRSHMTIEEDYAYYFKPPEGWSFYENPIFGDFAPYPTYALGGIILALSRYLELETSPDADDLMRRLVKFVVEKSGTFEKDGRFFGHTHSGGILTAAAGIARWAIYIGNKELLQQMKDTFDWTLQYSSSWGWVPDGLGSTDASSETCSITDAIHLGLIMARHVEPSYYEVVERFARNQLLENQFKRTETSDTVLNLKRNTAVADALYGSWASHSFPNSLDNGFAMVEGCCLGSGIRGCFLVWDSIVEKIKDTVYVHMSFSRNSPWVEIISYLPYKGKIDVMIHDDTKLQVRIPSWVKVSEMVVYTNDKVQPVSLTDQGYLIFKGLKKNDLVSISFTLKRIETCENVNGFKYQVQWRGDVVTAISPKGLIYPIYERSCIETDQFPVIDGQPYVNQLGGPIHW